MSLITDRIHLIVTGEDRVRMSEKFKRLAGHGHVSEVLIDLIVSWCDYKESQEPHYTKPVSKPPYKITKNT